MRLSKLIVFASIALALLLVVATSFEIFWHYQLPHKTVAASEQVESEQNSTEQVASTEQVHNSKDGMRVLLEKGWNLRQISNELERRGAVRHGYFFELLVRAFWLDGSLQAGEYMLAERSSLYDILLLLLSGKTVRYSITIPEGLTYHQISALVRAAEHLDGERLPQVAEGNLLADTYYYRRGDSRASIISRMEKAMQSQLKSAWFGERSEISRKFLRNKRDILTLASLIERETGIASERALVASVFYNRLELGMKLQTDPTLIYWESEKRGILGRGLRRSELRRDHPYNTYVHAGLPPTPIANPGRASISAALEPASSDYLYFVADGKGGHSFAKTFAEHLRNVRIWRKVEAARQSKPKDKSKDKPKDKDK